MGSWRYLPVLVLVLLWSDLAHAVAPLLCSSNICRINPTQNTVTLEKPFCFYTPSANVFLYVVKDSANDKTISLANKYSTTNGGSTAPYAAGNFTNLDCNQNPSTNDTNNYVYRVGSDENCFTSTYCNLQLDSNTKYRFMYVFYDTNNNNILYQSDWSAPITTKQGKSFGNIDTWPGRRSGGMIVLTSILSVLTFLVLAGLVAAMITYLMSPAQELETVRPDFGPVQVPQKPEGTVVNPQV
ncbi:uroplakin-3a [Engystomops pustulosus]|uniref:uroplakin-3a n=1 Tax=Engystomops pustulosus TaxID=76066 RepID=UPI003AFA498E